MTRPRRTKQESAQAKAVGKRLREARVTLGFSQAELAARIGDKSQRVVSHYEAGRASISPPLARRICSELGIQVGWLLTGEGHQWDPPGGLGEKVTWFLRTVPAASIREIEEELTLPRRTLHTCLTALKRMGWVEETRRGRWALTPRFVEDLGGGSGVLFGRLRDVQRQLGWVRDHLSLAREKSGPRDLQDLDGSVITLEDIADAVRSLKEAFETLLDERSAPLDPRGK